jgi:hypothetical protein
LDRPPIVHSKKKREKSNSTVGEKKGDGEASGKSEARVRDRENEKGKAPIIK